MIEADEKVSRVNGRNPRTGRFLPGNQMAKENRGNCNPKWGNKNALVTGEHERIGIQISEHLVYFFFGTYKKSILVRLPKRR